MLYTSIALVGLKHSGKSTVGRLLAGEWGTAFRDLDTDILSLCGREGTIRQLYKLVGRDAFLALETEAAEAIAAMEDRLVLATGGGTIENGTAMAALTRKFRMVFLDVPENILVERVFRGGIPAFVDPDRPEDHFREICRRRRALIKAVPHVRIDAVNHSPGELVAEIVQRLQEQPGGR